MATVRAHETRTRTYKEMDALTLHTLEWYKVDIEIFSYIMRKPAWKIQHTHDLLNKVGQK